MEDTLVNFFLKKILISIDIGAFGSSRCILQTFLYCSYIETWYFQNGSFNFAWNNSFSTEMVNEAATQRDSDVSVPLMKKL